MKPDYTLIGRRIAKRRKTLNLTQEQVSEMAEITPSYMSNIECAKSIPSTEVIMRLAAALDTTPDEFLVGAARQEGEEWKNVAQLLRPMDEKQLALARSLLAWLSEQTL